MKKVSTSRPKQLIGYSDRIDFPDFGLQDVEAKIDTGAYTSALHCIDVQLISHNDTRQLQFTIASGQSGDQLQITTEQFQYKTIKNSFGQSEKRFVIRTRVRLMGKIIVAEFSLANRGSMRFPVLLGRKLIRNKFIVDVSLKDVSFRAKKQTP
ncbi:ATP-dependent zinc protease family protein [Tellurirhabdus bombi]|uniref:ATP-dependent zinc protease family protein n=1 Tax=Tellurirhabdus bombi TaxID=2907205 RepID=UPI001F253E29|nr:RimK/LysX family protein [Tellurirhabdus bombi]